MRPSRTMWHGALLILLSASLLAPFVCAATVAGTRTILSQISLKDAAAFKREVQSMIDNVSSVSNYSFSVGFYDGTNQIGWGSGSCGEKRTCTDKDRMLLGSGTKPYTAAAIMRLVESGVLGLDDLAHVHIDSVLKRLSGKTMEQLLGPDANLVTVGQLIKMQSGINDFDIPDYDHALLETANKVHPPSESVAVVANFSETFLCKPGNCTSYSSTNFILAGFVLLQHAPPGQTTWETYDQAAGLGLPKIGGYTNTFFPRTGPLNRGGLTCPGISIDYGPTTLFTQDSSILGWTCGNVAASADEVAKFYYDLLGPEPKIVSKESLAYMETWSALNKGWASGYIDYGAGLMIQNVSPKVGKLPPLDHIASYAGHGGDTYAFMSDNGYFPQLNVSISVIVNQDHDFMYPSYITTCKVVEIAAKYLGHGDLDLGCADANPNPKYVCQNLYGQETCVQSDYRGQDKASCEASCH